MNKQEILDLIKQQELRDQEFLVRGEKKAKETEVVFNAIKDMFIDEAIKRAITLGYKLSNINIADCVYICLVSVESFPVSSTSIETRGSFGMSYVGVNFANKDSESKNKAIDFFESFDYFLLIRNLELLLTKNGFTHDFRYYKTSKEALLNITSTLDTRTNTRLCVVSQDDATNNDYEIALSILGFIILIGLVFIAYIKFF